MERIEKAKYFLIGGLAIITTGLVGQIFIKHYSQILATTIKYLALGIGIVAMAFGVITLITGDKLPNIFQRGPKKTHEEQIKDIESNLAIARLRTQLKEEEAKQKVMDNRIDLQKAAIERTRAQTRQHYGQTSDKLPDILGNLQGVITDKNRNYGYSENYKGYDPITNLQGKKPKKGSALKGNVNIIFK